MFVAGVDGCKGGWAAFKVELATLAASVELVNLAFVLRNKPPDLACLGIDIPVGLLDGSRACDKAARKLLGQPRGTSVFPSPCRAATQASSYAEANASNKQRTGRGLNVFAWGIVPKIREVDDAITPECQQWAFEVHPEVCFWALAGGRPMAHRKKIPAGVEERLTILRAVFPDIEWHLRQWRHDCAQTS
jgi:predicted RNase H-like nuclease